VPSTIKSMFAQSFTNRERVIADDGFSMARHTAMPPALRGGRPT
jgi:hypothetical protein